MFSPLRWSDGERVLRRVCTVFSNAPCRTHLYDVIVIGSGIGGLTVASLLTQLRHQRVLVLERHFKLGGFTHVFERPGGFRWDVGLHYVGQMATGQLSRTLMDFITRGQVRWSPMPSPFEKFVFPDFTFEAPVGEAAYRKALIERFPDERSAIEQYLADVHRKSGGTGRPH